MKTLSTISLFIFGIILTAILMAGLVFYQNNKDVNNQVSGSKVSVVTQKTPTVKSLVLNMTEIAKHNKSSNCFMLISGKVYDITNFFGSHPGGNATMAATCGTDATDAYMTKDPNATSMAGGRNHSSRARNMLTDYYLGTLNQVITQ